MPRTTRATPTDDATTGIDAAAAALAAAAEREHARRSRIGVLIARGRSEDAAAALGVCWPGERLPRSVRAALARGRPERVEAFAKAFRASEPRHFSIPAADLGIPGRPGFGELVLLLRLDPDGGDTADRPDDAADGSGDAAADTTPSTKERAAQEEPFASVLELCRTHLLDLAIGRTVTLEQAPNSLASARARAVALGDPPLGSSKQSALVLWPDRGNPMIELLASGGRAIGDEILGPLSARTDEALTLRRALRAYLASGGRTGRTAAELGVHRNTLRNRLEKIEQLTGCSLASADDRAELWMALRLVTDADPRPVNQSA
ncbi:MAG: helix-turn-helix domain-containing protein [Leucobacter sp.]|nr:helix-turn-helix domain-containing protein [Leucobacter sp.]